ncbi:MAG: hypothetical protein LBQ51_06690 [Desulfovibrio sp.]|nr:hypothetical protein [Desulfovibrio sp.]
MKRRVVLSALIVFAFLSGACETMRGIDEQVRIDPSDKNIIYRDQWVRRNPPEVHVQPRSAPPDGLRALFVPFRVTQPMENPVPLGYGMARTVWQTWLTMRVFPNLEFSGDDTPYRRDRAAELGRRRNADLVIGGFVTYVYAGGTAGDTRLSLQIEAHDVPSGQLVWSMAQSGLIPAAQSTDFFLFTTRSRMPADPLHAVAQALASDMGLEVRNWMSGPAPRTRMQEFDKDVRDVLLPPRDPVPAPREAEQAGDDGPYPPARPGAF